MKHKFGIRRRLALLTSLVVAGAVALSGCGGSTPSTTGSSSTAGGLGAVKAALDKGGEITYWTWTPQAKAQVDAFQKAYPKVKVNLVNAGTGNDHYVKLQNAIKAGSGAPDVAQIEYFALPQFEFTGGLLDLAPYGFGSLKGDYTASTWNSVVSGNKIYGLPQDSGPMALFYNKKVFDQYGLTVPTTWDEYIADAQKLHAADPTKYITNDSGDAGFATSMIWQAGGKPFQSDGTKVTINLQDQGSKKWADMWNQLVTKGLVAPTSGWSSEWFTGLGNGTIATLVIGAWMPGNLESNVPTASGDWRVAPMPSYDGKPASAEQGGSAQVVMKQSKNPELAAGFLWWLNNSDQSISTFLAGGGFPCTVKQLKSDQFLNDAPAYFGGQKINQVLAASADSVVSGWQYLPFQVYANSIVGDTLGQSYANKSDLNAGLQAWQNALVTYGNSQGFSVNK